MYVLDNDSVDGSTDNLPCERKIVHNDVAFSHVWLVETVQGFCRELLERYPVVLFCEVDEIVWHPDGIDKFMMNMPYTAPLCTGFEVWHNYEEEPEIDLNRPILEQRKYWKHVKAYDKPSVTKKVLNWSVGFHAAVDAEGTVPHLYLIHTHFLDLNVALRRQEVRHNYKFHEDDIKQGRGYYQVWSGQEYIDNWYNTRRATDLIPEEIREKCVI